MHREDVQGLEGHGVVAADHVLVAQEVGEVGDQGVSDPLILLLGNEPAAQFQPQELALVEHLPVAAIAPTQQAVRLVTGGDGIFRHEACAGRAQQGRGLVVAGEVGSIGPFEEAAGVARFAAAAVVLHGEHPVPGRPGGGSGIGGGLPAVGADTTVSLCRPIRAQFRRAGGASAGMLAVSHLVQVAAGVADHHVQRVAFVLGQQVAGEKVEPFPAVAALVLFHPEEVFHVGMVGAALVAGGAVEWADLLFQRLHQAGSGSAVRPKVQVLNLPVNDPPRHGVDVVPQHITPHPVGLDEGRAATHEGVGDGEPIEVISGEEGLLERLVAVFGEEQPPEQGPRPPGEPLVHGDDRPVVLLDLFFTQGQGGDEGDVEVGFYGHGG